MIDLSSNENPYEPSQGIIEAVMRGSCSLNRYLRPSEIDALKKALSNYNDVSSERIIVAHGTDCILRDIILNFSKNRDLITLNPSFPGLSESAKYTAKRILKIQLAPPEYTVDFDDAIQGPALVIADYPNSPTGRCLIKREQLIEVLKSSDNLVVIDEAYYEFSKKTFADLVDEYPNLAISRTLDKAFSLAGLRVSYLIAGDSFLGRLSPYSQALGRPACLAAIAALEDKEYALGNVEKIIDERERLRKGLEMAGLDVTPSETNFLLVRTSIPEFASRLRKRNILIGDFSHTWLKNNYRITVGTQKENDSLLNEIWSIHNSKEQYDEKM
ncbi:histidinol-phosphate aminotransferase HisC (plasmid) [Peptoclostridium acidaminophilum DSM 3953]|uniref:histidinol-phosphate transaminase n=1 Tax=Peptoclostridium acidaminophilum DSM 3953 TaxID=1286171 RepID=W8TNX5_PEPAC|nr:aminotransferase class I/II-fold pyridoxal phosphate-dependent enzyme [Peptoclostridium acidaminophilum]AHM57857.1 histidinol-phosphate aminotransferase HisC [Peptoclostridium acidaminophilum DSM 3953]